MEEIKENYTVFYTVTGSTYQLSYTYLSRSLREAKIVARYKLENHNSLLPLLGYAIQKVEKT